MLHYLVLANAKVVYRSQLSEFTGEQFESFFHKLMAFEDPSFVPVRTHQGDQGADGLTLHLRKLYACYSSQTKNVSSIRSKFNRDIRSAMKHRETEFDTFVFVHNDTSGTHPGLASDLVKARDEYPGVRFEMLDETRLWRKCMRLGQPELQDLLDCELQVRELEYRIGLDDLSALLGELHKHRVLEPGPDAVPEPSRWKLDYNALPDEDRENLAHAFTHSHKVRKYYDGARNPQEHEEVAAGFHCFYLDLRAQALPADTIMRELELYVLGNGRTSLKQQLTAYVVLAHFFEHCYIFDNPPPGWRPAPNGVDHAAA